MRRICVVFAVLLLAATPALLAPGCGSGGEKEGEEGAAMFAIQEILVPRERDSSFVVAWTRRSTGIGDVSIEQLGLRFWKWEGSGLVEITLEEYKDLGARHRDGSTSWTYSQHTVTVMELDEKKGEAVVEISSLYGPLTGAGIRYLLRREGGSWKKVSEETVWISMLRGGDRVTVLPAHSLA